MAGSVLDTKLLKYGADLSEDGASAYTDALRLKRCLGLISIAQHRLRVLETHCQVVLICIP